MEATQNGASKILSNVTTFVSALLARRSFSIGGSFRLWALRHAL
jgi:hypothetical protein